MLQTELNILKHLEIFLKKATLHQKFKSQAEEQIKWELIELGLGVVHIKNKA